jgi:DNA-directed RNA polymerase subunit RPC12/RpoP
MNKMKAIEKDLRYNLKENYKCKKCGKKFRLKALLRTHQCHYFKIKIKI